MELFQTIGKIIIDILIILLIMVYLYNLHKSKFHIKIDKTKVKEYEKFYDSKLINEELKECRKEKIFQKEKVKLYITSIIVILITVIYGRIDFDLETLMSMHFLKSIIICCLLIYALYRAFIQKEKNYVFKKIALRNMLYDKYPTATYDSEDGISLYEYEKSFRRYSKIYTNYYTKDLIRYDVKDSNISIARVKTTKDTKKIRSLIKERTTFDGFVGYYELKRHFEVDRLYVGCRKGYRVDIMDSEIFNDKFYASSNDKVALYKILTPNNMERLIDVLKTISSLELLLLDNRLYFKFENPDMPIYKNDVAASSIELYKFDMLLKTISNICTEIEKELIEKIG